MAKQGKIARTCVWERGMKFKSGKRRGEKVIDFIIAGGHTFYCLRSHRATCKTHPFGLRGKHYWAPVLPITETRLVGMPVMAEEAMGETTNDKEL